MADPITTTSVTPGTGELLWQVTSPVADDLNTRARDALRGEWLRGMRVLIGGAPLACGSAATGVAADARLLADLDPIRRYDVIVRPCDEAEACSGAIEPRLHPAQHVP